MIYNDIALFVGVAKTGSFSRAAQELGLSLSTVSRRIIELETLMGMKLFERTTRHVRLTDAGRLLLDRAEAPIETLTGVIRTGTTAGGTIRVTAPPLAARTRLGKRLLDFLAAEPAVRIELIATNAYLDFIEDNIDIAFRLGPLADSTLVAVKLWDVPYAVCASAELIRACGGAATIDARSLPHLPCIHTGQAWRFEALPSFKLHNIAHRIEEMELAAQFVERGLGFGYLPLDMAMKAGIVLDKPDLRAVPRPLFALYPSRRLLPNHLRRLIEHMRHG